ncbi:4-hydroxyphenylacetate decarboxylase small subunit [Tepidibacter aestuarii]|uniref:4-hydroxyphenylacetate decarboxylase small subunit n=1 Tax=Tepidibacter aestuarii TaxID=2925782 RepID=UPI0020C03B12|nr:4-hydroxyphenylacetate decarboxylase small subunit [Tepidibacter aestuarii]CAH2214872.1 4-hydroxyphenylacetate decarboxylase small subunit [Tepidibacter aestuarii]
MLKHNDCLNFSPMDAAKGICRVTGNMINIDSDVCEVFELCPKCRNCSNFKNSDKDELGMCTGLDKDNWTYGDLNAVTCNSHEFKK